MAAPSSRTQAGVSVELSMAMAPGIPAGKAQQGQAKRSPVLINPTSNANNISWRGPSSPLSIPGRSASEKNLHPHATLRQTHLSIASEKSRKHHVLHDREPLPEMQTIMHHRPTTSAALGPSTRSHSPKHACTGDMSPRHAPKTLLVERKFPQHGEQPPQRIRRLLKVEAPANHNGPSFEPPAITQVKGMRQPAGSASLRSDEAQTLAHIPLNTLPTRGVISSQRAHLK